MIENKIETELSGRPNPPWHADVAGSPSEAEPPPAEAKARTVFGLAGELKNLVRDDRKHRSEHARRLKRAKNYPRGGIRASSPTTDPSPGVLPANSGRSTFALRWPWPAPSPNETRPTKEKKKK